jgi:hypothetical protein
MFIKMKLMEYIEENVKKKNVTKKNLFFDIFFYLI